jgi:hypothetical protein
MATTMNTIQSAERESVSTCWERIGSNWEAVESADWKWMERRELRRENALSIEGRSGMKNSRTLRKRTFSEPSANKRTEFRKKGLRR